MCLAKDQFTSIKEFFQKQVQIFWWLNALSFFIDCLVIALPKKAITVSRCEHVVFGTKLQF